MARKKEAKDEKALGGKWIAEIEFSSRQMEKWVQRSKNTIKRYRDERDAIESKRRKFNILWSNTQILKSALYGRMPQPEVTRRYKDSDPIARTAALMLERCLEYEVQQYPDFHRTLTNVVEDRLLPGRGSSWIRYEPNIVTEPQISEDADASIEHLSYECAPTDYVHWSDFFHEPCRVWEEVTWVARRVYMTFEEGQQRFGEAFRSVPMTKMESTDDLDSNKTARERNKGEVYEVWDKTKKEVIWVARGLEQELDVKPDPLELEEFFPCPRPLYATVTTGSLVPIPDYCMYQDQAEELDLITHRISRITKALKVVGVYNAEYPALKRMLDEGVDNQLVPVDGWASFAEKNGLSGAVNFMPLKEVIETLIKLHDSRNSIIQTIYEITGISDIVRGASNPNETLGAQQMKAQFGSMRIRQPQEEVARFATDLLRAKAQIICKFYSDQTIISMSGIEGTDDAAMAPQALQLLRQGQIKDFRINVAADTLAQMDDQQEKQDRIEFLTSVSAYLDKALPVIMNNPEAGPLLGEILMFGVRGFKVGRVLEAAFEQAMSKLGQPRPEKPDPALEAAKMKSADMDKELQFKQQAESTRLQFDMQAKQAELQNQMALKQMELEHDTQKHMVEISNRTAVEKERIQQSAKPAVNVEASPEVAALLGASNEAVNAHADTLGQSLQIFAQALGHIAQGQQAMMQQSIEHNRALAEAFSTLAQAMTHLTIATSAPREVVLQRDASGKAIGARSAVALNS